MAEKEPEDYSKLPLDEKLTHKVWRARLMGYEEAAKFFRRIDDEASSDYSKYTGMIKKFVIDSNQMAQEKGVEAALAFVESAAAASKICSDVVTGVVTKCLGARPKTKEGGILLCLMFVEIEQHAVVQEEVTKGFSNKQPKIVAASVLVLNRVLQEFGARVINLKILMKSILPLFEHNDKNVRAEAKSLAIELFRWFGVAIKPSLEKSLKPVQLKELEEEWAKLPGIPPIPPRRLRSDQAAAASVTDVPGDDGESGGDDGGGEDPAYALVQVDPYDLADPVDMLGKMPKDFFDKVVDVKWKERKEVLEAVLPLAQSMKLESGDYGELVKALKKVITKDSNVMVVALAGNIVTGLAKGLRNGFQSYSSFILSGILEKFKEKKLNVVNSLRDAADAVYLTTTLGGIQEEAVEALKGKNPSVKTETLLFLCRCFQQCTPAMVPKPLLKAWCPLIVEKLEDTTPQVREAAQETLGTLLRVVGDRPMNAYLEGIDKGKMAKIQEHREAVELKIQTGVIQSPMKGQAAAGGGAKVAEVKSKSAGPKKKVVAAEGDDEQSEPVKKKPVLSSQKKPPKKRSDAAKSTSETPEQKPQPASAPPKKKPAAAASGGGSKGKGKGKGKGGASAGIGEPPDQPEPSIANEEVEQKAAGVLPSGILEKLADPKWKERLEACELFQQLIEGLAPSDMQSLLFCKVLARKPGWKDSNFQVMNAKFAIVATLAGKAAVFGKKSTAFVLPALVEKFADIKVKGKSSETLKIIAERMTLNYTSLLVMKSAFEHKSPKVQSESLDWLGQAIKEFGFLINAKPHIDFIKKAFGASNPAVRTAAINLIGVLHLYLGAQVRMFFEEEKPALLQQIDAAFEKVSGETAPVPTRGPNVRGEEDEDEGDEDDEAGGVGGAAQPVSLADLMPKVDISGQIKPDLIKELADKNWKVRGESLQRVQEIIKTAKFVQPSLGDLPGGLKGRLADSNKKLIITTLGIIGSLATAMGSGCSKYVRAFLPGVLSSLSDSNPGVRLAGMEALNAWQTELTLAPMLEQELISNALATESPHLRTELLGWLQEKLPESGKLPSELTLVIPQLFSCLEDRSGDVRKKAQALVPVLMAKVGYEVMTKQASKLKGSSKQTVVGILEKHRASAPPPKAKQPPPAAAAPPPPEDKPAKQEKKQEKGADKTKSSSKSATSGKGSATKGKGQKKGGSSTAEVSSGAPLVYVPNGKENRMKDEEKLKTLKWNFNQPRSEHIEQLKEQLVPCVSADLHSQLFHDDFKKHITALATFTKCVSGDAPHKDAAIGCIDLLLRWVTLRFFETNTTVNLKCLEFLRALFKMLVDDGNFRMSDYEANGFLPHLVTKVGDSKEPVRKGVRSLFRELCSFYPPGKLFSFVIDGLKSKNARQRTECLEELGLLIQYNGMAVCGSQPQKTIPLIAHQITDRDNAVRSAALNAIVVVYVNLGEGVYKYTSQLSSKDVSLLEERIRRSGKKPISAEATPSEQTPPPQEDHGGKTGQQPKGNKFKAVVPPDTSAPSQSESTPAPKEGTPAFVDPPSEHAPPPKPTGPFKSEIRMFKLPERSKFQYTNGSSKLSTEDLALIQGPEPPRPKIASRYMSRPGALAVSPSRLASTSEAINFIISQITSNDSDTCFKGIKQIEAVIVSPSQRPAITPHVDQLLRALLMQMRMNFSTPLTSANDPESQEEVMRVAKMLNSCMVRVLEEPSLALLVSQDTLIEIERDVTAYLPDERLLKIEDAPQLLKVFNYLMLRLCENCDKTAVFGSLLQVLAKSIGTDGTQTKQTELAMKCLWKVTRQLPQFLPSINLDRLLFEIHHCFETYSQLVPPPSQGDTPYRTVKTILYHLTNSVGDELLDHLSLIKDSKKSQVTQYIRRTLAKKRHSTEKSTAVSGSETKKQTISKTSSSLSALSLPPGARSTLNEIFKKIGTPSETKMGLSELYRFKQQHPDIDISECIKGTSKFYQSYIERGLKSIECELSADDTGSKGAGSAFGDTNGSCSESYVKSLKAMKAIRSRASQLMNIPDEPQAQSEKPAPTHTSLPTAVVNSKPSDENMHPAQTRSQLKAPGGSAANGSHPATGGAVGGGSLNLDDLRRRLDRLKGTSAT